MASSGRPSSHYSAADDVGEIPAPSSFMQFDAPHGHPSARAVFDFSASSPFELSISGKYIFHRHVASHECMVLNVFHRRDDGLCGRGR